MLGAKVTQKWRENCVSRAVHQPSCFSKVEAGYLRRGSRGPTWSPGAETGRRCAPLGSWAAARRTALAARRRRTAAEAAVAAVGACRARSARRAWQRDGEETGKDQERRSRKEKKRRCCAVKLSSVKVRGWSRDSTSDQHPSAPAVSCYCSLPIHPVHKT